jgi:transposase-like protein
MSSDINFKGYELTQMEKEEILDKASRLYASLHENFQNVTLQLCVNHVIRAYASYNPDEETVGKYA